MPSKRKRITKSAKKLIWQKTNGRCHFCGKKLVFNAKRGSRGLWHVDHIFQLKHGGSNSIDNLLPVCGKCNGLRGAINSKRMKKVFIYGLIAQKEVKQGTAIGNIIRGKYNKRKEVNEKRRDK